MRIKLKMFKRIISLLCVIPMAISSMINSVGAIDTMEAEAAFSMVYMNCLPEKGKADFDKFSGKFERGEAKDKSGKKFCDTLQEEKLYENVKYSDGFNGFKNDDVTIKEKEVYVKIKKKVKELKDKVDERTPKHKKYSGKSSKNLDKSRSWRIAKAIYRWVAKTIKYDYDSLGKEYGRSLKKPQDPLFVFDQKMGVCVGKANLINLMMRLAGIPSVVIVSETHAFNAIYLKDKNNPNRTGWTLIDVTWGSPESDMELQTGQKEKIKNIEEMLKMSCQQFVKTDFGGLNNRFVDRIDQINRLSNRGKLKNSKEYGKEFRVFCENLFDDNKDELKNNVNTMYSILLKYCGQEDRVGDSEKKSMELARKKVGNIVEDMNKKIKSEISKLNQQDKYKDIAKIRHFKINFSEDRLVTNDISKMLFASMEVDLSSKEAEKIEEKFSYWSDNMKEFFPGFYGKTLSFKCANEDIIDKCAHKVEQMVFGNWFDETGKNSVFNLKIDGVTYERLIDKEGEFDGIKLIGDENRSLENVKISPDMANLGIPFEIGRGIKSLILKGNESIDWSNVGSLESVDITESNRYMVENGVLYGKKDGSKVDKVDVPKKIQIINQKDNKEKIEKEEKERLERQKLENDKKKKKIIKRIVKKKVRKSKKVDDNIVQRKEREDRERLEREKKEREDRERLEREKKEREDRERLEREKREKEEKERLERQKLENDKKGKKKKIIKRIVKKKVKKLQKANKEKKQVVQEEKATENKNEIPKETRERIKKLKQIIKDIDTKIENEQNKLRYQNSRNAMNSFLRLANLKIDIENIENELKNENFKDNNKLVEYENQINKLANECGFETV